MRRLLNHSAGLTVDDVGSYGADETLPTLVQALDGLPPAHSEPIRVDVVPGTKWRYSGGGYLVGEYDANGIRATITTDGEQLFAFASPLGPQRVRLYPSAEDRFFLLDQDVDLRFVKDTQGHVTEMRALANGQAVTAIRVK